MVTAWMRVVREFVSLFFLMRRVTDIWQLDEACTEERAQAHCGHKSYQDDEIAKGSCHVWQSRFEAPWAKAIWTSIQHTCSKYDYPICARICFGVEVHGIRAVG